jgi:hypothetical protein
VDVGLSGIKLPSGILQVMTFPPQQERVQACVYEEFSVPSADAETLLSGAKQTLTNAIPSVEMHVSQGQKVFANDKGFTILERLDQLETDVRDLRSELRSVQRVFYNTRERTYLTYLQDFWNEFGTPRYLGAKKTPLHTQVARRVNKLNSRGVYAGDLESDAAMFTVRRPFKSDDAFIHLYGLSAPEINEIGKFSCPPFFYRFC